MYRSQLITLAALPCLACSCAPDVPEQISRPNIVLMLTDDQGWQDTSEPFADERTPQNDLYRTPNMERLASEGMKFTNSYSNAVCTPTRVELLTGLNQVRTRISNWTHFRDEATDRPHPDLIIPRWNTNGLQPVPDIPLSLHAKTLPQELRNAGYRTIHIGKGHFGTRGTPGEDPKALGFDVRIGGRFSGAPGSYYGTDNFASGGDPDSTPWRAWRFVQRYLDAGLPEREAAYASMIEGVDKSLGDIMDTLEGLGVADNTALFFTSDNGGVRNMIERDGEPNTHNAPLNSGKGSTYEGGLRVPMLAKWPGVTQPGRVSDTPITIEDMFPTILDIAGVEFSGQSGAIFNDDGIIQLGPELDGESFVPLLRGEAGNPERTLYWHFPHAWGGLSRPRVEGPGIGATSTIKRGDWKLVYWHVDGRKELFNLRADIGETRNLAADQPELVADLSAALGKFLRETNAIMPTRKATSAPVPYPDGP
ncbi:MAG: sulfatase [Acidobacteriia bacterium]|nr:sulfatase [Terriglobia bacterium]